LRQIRGVTGELVLELDRREDCDDKG
jgi:hypothetical protein